MHFHGETQGSYRPAVDIMDMAGQYNAQALIDPTTTGDVTAKRELVDSRWTGLVSFYAQDDYPLTLARVGIEMPASYNETTVPAMVDGEPNPALRPHVLGDVEAASLNALTSLSQVVSPMSEWTDGRDDMLDSHLALTGSDVRVYEVPANTTLLSVRGPRWYPRNTGSRCYFAVDPPLRFYGDVWAVPANGSHVGLNYMNGEIYPHSNSSEAELDWHIVSSNVGFGNPPKQGIDSVDTSMPIQNFSFPERNVTVGEFDGQYERGPTIEGVRLFFTRLDPTLRYNLTIGSQQSICVFDRLELVQAQVIKSDSGLSDGAIAGIVVGSVIGGLGLLLLAFLLWRRRKSAAKRAQDFEIADVATHEGKPFADMGAPTPILAQSEFPDHQRSVPGSEGSSRDSRGLSMLGSTGSLPHPTSGGQSVPTLVRHEEDAGFLEAELPEGTGGGEVVLPPVYQDDWVNRRSGAGRGLGISTDMAARSHRSPHALTAEEIKYLGPPTPSATMPSSPITPGEISAISAHTFGSWMTQPLSPGAQVSPIGSQPLSPLSAAPAGKSPPRHPAQRGAPPESPVSPTPLSPLGSHTTGSAPDDADPLVTPFPPDLRPSKTTPHGFPKDVKP